MRASWRRLLSGWVVLFGLVVLAPLAYAQGSVAGNSGAFTTSIPIEVPPGRNGLTPQLSFVYSSSTNNGLLGVGWSLSGFSVIERASPGKGSPRYDASDIYLLDGQELIPCGASTLAGCTSGGTHFTKMESNTRIKYSSADNTWTVWQKNGTKSTYVSSYGVPSGTFRWALSNIFDTNGNSIGFSQWCDPSADCYPDTINYNTVTIKFYYDPRGDVITFAN